MSRDHELFISSVCVPSAVRRKRKPVHSFPIFLMRVTSHDDRVGTVNTFNVFSSSASYVRFLRICDICMFFMKLFKLPAPPPPCVNYLGVLP